MRMLRKSDTGELFIYTQILAERDDMELVEVPDPSKPEKATMLQKSDTPDFNEMGKKDILSFIFDHYGERIDGRLSLEITRKEAERIVSTKDRV